MSGSAHFADYKGLRFQLDGYLKPGQTLNRNMLFDALYASLPRDPQARVQIYNYEIAPKQFTDLHCHNVPTFFVVLQGQFQACFEEGVLVNAKAGDVYSEPIARMHRGHNPHPELANIGIGFSITATDRDPVTNVVLQP